jgi:hypothetical protein
MLIRRKTSSRALSFLGARGEGHRRARQYHPTSLPRPARATQFGPNMLPKRDASSAFAQSAIAELLPRRQAQPAVVQEQGGLRLLRARPPLFCHTHTTTTACIRPHRAACNNLARRRVARRVCATGCPRMSDCAAQCSTRERAGLHPPQMQLHCTQHVRRDAPERYALPALQQSQRDD